MKNKKTATLCKLRGHSVCMLDTEEVTFKCLLCGYEVTMASLVATNTQKELGRYLRQTLEADKRNISRKEALTLMKKTFQYIQFQYIQKKNFPAKNNNKRTRAKN